MIKKANQTIIQKLICSIICIMLVINFTIPTYSQAGIGNALFSPIKGLVCGIADTVVSLLQSCFIGEFKGVISDEGTAGDMSRWGSILWIVENKVEWPTILITPEEIFQGKIPALNVNFIKQIDDWDTLTNGGTLDASEVLSTEKTQISLITLRNTISKWYMALRNIAVVGLLSVLVYVGIRMMLCSVASEKAKYKQMLMDWIIALCLVFFLHYIMALTMTVVEAITSIFSNSSVAEIGLMAGDEITLDGESSPRTSVSNLMEYARVYISLADVGQSCAYIIIYVWLIVYTVKFIIVYMKRFIHMAFLTMIAPLVALTYPLDKLGDGKAQAFNMWLKDYVFNALIQPFHLIIYTVFVSSAMEFATTNLIYACVAIGFITPAEKFLRKMFGFDKAPNPPGGLGGFAGGALASQAVNKLRSGVGKSGGNGDSEKNAGTPARTKPNYGGYVGNNAGNANMPEGPSDGNGRNALPEGNEGQGGSANNGQDNTDNNPTDWSGSYSGGEFDDLGYGGAQNSLEQGPDGENNEDNGDGNGSQEETPPSNEETPPPSNAAEENTGHPTRPRQVAGSGNQQREISGIKKFGKGMLNVGKKRWKRGLKTALGVGGGLVGGAAMGIHALATGKDAGEIFKSAALGAAGGASLGYNSVDKAIGLGNGIRSAGRNLAYDYRAGYDKEGADKQLEKGQFLQDKRQKQFIKQNFAGQDGGEIHGKELKQRMEQSYALYEAGVTDDKTRKKVMDLEDQINNEILERLDENERNDPERVKETRELARQQALITNELAGQYSASNLLKDQEKIRNSIAGNIEKQAQEQGITMTQEQIANNADVALQRLADYHDVSLSRPSNNNNTRQNNQQRNNTEMNRPRNNT